MRSCRNSLAFCIVTAGLTATAQTTRSELSLTPRELFYRAPLESAAGSDHHVDHPSESSPRQGDGRVIRYSVLRGRPDGSFQAVDVYRTTFHSGDHVRLRIEASHDIFLTIIQLGSRGKFGPLFPSAAIDNGRDRIPAHRAYEIPPDPGFTFDDNAGEEHVFVIASQNHIDVAALVAALNQPSSKPVIRSDTPTEDSLREIAQTSTNMGSRDLVFEREQEESPGGLKEVVFYAHQVKTPSGPSPSVVHFTLKHAGGGE